MNLIRKSLKGFTLVELIVVIAIVGILTAILVPTLFGYINGAKYKAANSNAKQIYTAATTYITEYGANPTVQDKDGNTVDRIPPSSIPVTTINAWTADNYQCLTMMDSVDKYMGTDSVGSYYILVIVNGTVNRTFWSETVDSSHDIIGSYPIVIDPDFPQFTKMSQCVDVTTEVG